MRTAVPVVQGDGLPVDPGGLRRPSGGHEAISEFQELFRTGPHGKQLAVKRRRLVRPPNLTEKRRVFSSVSGLSGPNSSALR